MLKINREEMLELTRRMTISRTAMTRIAGCYMDKDGFVDGTFNTNFLKLSQAQKSQNLALAKIIPFSETNVNLKRYRFPQSAYAQAQAVSALCCVCTVPVPSSISRMISSTAGTVIRLPWSGFLMLIIGVVIVASTLLLSKARSQPSISQLMSFSPLQ